MVEPKVVTLEEPIVLDGQTYSELRFERKTRMRDLVAMNGRTDPTEQQCALVASIAGVPFEVLLEVTELDMGRALLAMNDLMGEPVAPSGA